MVMTGGFVIALSAVAATAVAGNTAYSVRPVAMRASADTVTGCLSKGDEAGEYTLMTKGGKKYELKSTSVDLSKHVGHTVTATGTAKKEEEKGEKGEETDMQVTKLAMVSASCS
jgi:hypothetical protein